ncbi:hypothetical protein [Salipiger sp. PrR003]|uniref:hypothetical protein n=1 Tax=Salipiger sp. PrR003 TaxID=2706776 RepID=UPI0013D94166|nr:hypothetical protein [Salipiger sp. PrR003]NDV53012.1 hypothetical protein [Salipiger sp. PrR003]
MHRFLIGCILLSACSAAQLPSEEMISSTANVSAAYREGFDDGCSSGRQASGSSFNKFEKNQERFNTDTDYAQGWSDAFRQCETQEEARQRQMRSTEAISALELRSRYPSYWY